jgi:hypothetical protein
MWDPRGMGYGQSAVIALVLGTSCPWGVRRYFPRLRADTEVSPYTTSVSPYTMPVSPDTTPVSPDTTPVCPDASRDQA